jgi:hypothetical protein
MQVVNLQTYVVARILANKGLIFDQYRPTKIPGYDGSLFQLTEMTHFSFFLRTV